MRRLSHGRGARPNGFTADLFSVLSVLSDRFSASAYQLSVKSWPRNQFNHNKRFPDVRCGRNQRFQARHEARFVKDWREHCRPLDRNQRARIVVLAEALERRTKPAGCRNGQLGYVGIQVLRTLVFTFMNPATGLLCPSYAALQEKTGLCCQSIGKAIARLERAAILRIVRRLCRQWVQRVNPTTGQPERYLGTTQTTSLYSVHPPGVWADHLVRPTGRQAPFPSPRRMHLLERMQLIWKSRLQLSRRDHPEHARQWPAHLSQHAVVPGARCQTA